MTLSSIKNTAINELLVHQLDVFQALRLLGIKAGPILTQTIPIQNVGT